MNKPTFGPFLYKPPDWVNTKAPADSVEALNRAWNLSRVFYPLGVQTGIHSMIEWCGVMGEYVKMLRHAYETQGVDPERVDQHSGVAVQVPEYMIEYFCEKLGCQIKPFIRSHKAEWKKHIDKWFE